MEKSVIKWAVDADQASLLVFDIPMEFSADGMPMKCLAIPVRQRAGGFLLAVPIQSLNQDKLIDEIASDGTEMLGPSKSFSCEMIQEDDSGGFEHLEVPCRCYIVDFTDDVLLFLKEYDEFDEANPDIIPFHADYPGALPRVGELDDQIMQWAKQQHVGRAHFYPAREDLSSPSGKPPPATKKAAPKRVTNAALMDHIKSLNARLDAMAKAQGSAPPAEVPNGGIEGPQGPKHGLLLSTPQMPRLSDALTSGLAGGTPSMHTV